MVQLYYISVVQHLNILRLFVNVGNLFRVLKCLCDVHEFDGDLFLGFLMLREVYNSKPALTDYFINNVIVQNGTIVKRFAVKSNVENILWFNELNVVYSQVNSVLVVQLCFTTLLILSKLPT